MSAVIPGPTGDTVIVFDNLTHIQRTAVWRALEALDVDFHTVVMDGQAVYFSSRDTQAADLRNLQADLVAAALVRAFELDEANLNQR
jgi:hypothetical protein